MRRCIIRDHHRYNLLTRRLYHYEKTLNERLYIKNSKISPVSLLSSSSRLQLSFRHLSSSIEPKITTARTTTSSSSSSHQIWYAGSIAVALAAAAGMTMSPSLLQSQSESEIVTTNFVDDDDDDDPDDDLTTIVNWSGTHSITTSRYYEPESLSELESIVRECHLKGQSMRPIGSALSPNGIGFTNTKQKGGGGMIGMARMDKIINVDVDKMEVTVQAGARVSQVIDALRPYKLTLPNLASIAEQQMGGFTQIGAHGTGRLIPPVDDFVTSLTIVTPAFGTLRLSSSDDDKNPSLFPLFRCGLGCLGIVAELTMKCVPYHFLKERTVVMTRREVVERVDELLEGHKHVRFMWIPYEDAVVVVTNDVVVDKEEEEEEEKCIKSTDNHDDMTYRLEPFTTLLKELSTSQSLLTEEDINGMGFGELRDALLAIDPLSVEHVKKVNKAEAEFWRRSQGEQIKPSDELLQFDCGGQQWVKEVCFHTGTTTNNTHTDMTFLTTLLHHIDNNKIPAPSPIEQRWSSSSSSPMSPAHSIRASDLFSWVGIIMYLPTDDEDQRRKITKAFNEVYCQTLHEVGQQVVVGSVDSATTATTTPLLPVVSHWGKIEQPTNNKDRIELMEEMRRRYPVMVFNMARLLVDPKGLLSNDLINSLFGTPMEAWERIITTAKTKGGDGEIMVMDEGSRRLLEQFGEEQMKKMAMNKSR